MNGKYADWLTKREAADRLRVSERTIMRYADEKLIQQRMRPKKGNRDIAVYNPSDIERLLSEKAMRDGVPFVLSAPPATSLVPVALERTEGAIAPAAALPAASQAFAAAIGEAIARALSAVKPSEQVYRPDEAATYAKRSIEQLRELRKQGKLPNAGTPGRVLYRRADLDAL